MNPPVPSRETVAAAVASVVRGRWQRGSRWLRSAAVLFMLLLSPSSYRCGNGTAIALQLWSAVAARLAPFLLLSSLLQWVLIRLVVATAERYALAPLAFEAVLRILVLELVPLFTAAFVALEITLPAAADLARLRTGWGFDERPVRGGDPLRHEVLPRVLAGMLALPMFAVLAAVVALLLSYLQTYGATPWGWPAFTRVVGQVAAPALLAVAVAKSIAFSMIVALLPAASVLGSAPGVPHDSRRTLTLLVRLSVLLLLVEGLALAGIYL